MMQRALERHRNNDDLAEQMFTTFEEITTDHQANLEILMENTRWVHPPSEPARGGGLKQIVEVLEYHEVCLDEYCCRYWACLDASPFRQIKKSSSLDCDV